MVCTVLLISLANRRRISLTAKGDQLLLGRLHAEGKLLTEAMNLGAQPGLLVASRAFCDKFCAPSIERTGGKILTPTMARW